MTSPLVSNNVVETALMLAIKTGNIRSANQILDNPSFNTKEIHQPDNNGLLPIHWACLYRQNEIIEKLIKMRTHLDVGPTPSSLYELDLTSTETRLIFNDFIKKRLPQEHPLFIFIPDIIRHAPSISKNSVESTDEGSNHEVI